MIIWNYSGIKSEKKCNLEIILDDLNYFLKIFLKAQSRKSLQSEEKLKDVVIELIK